MKHLKLWHIAHNQNCEGMLKIPLILVIVVNIDRDATAEGAVAWNGATYRDLFQERKK